MFSVCVVAVVVMDDVLRVVVPDSKGKEDDASVCVSVAVKFVVSKTLKNVIAFIESKVDVLYVASSIETMIFRP
jgi:hypothetical protein